VKNKYALYYRCTFTFFYLKYVTKKKIPPIASERAMGFETLLK